MRRRKLFLVKACSRWVDGRVPGRLLRLDFSGDEMFRPELGRVVCAAETWGSEPGYMRVMGDRVRC